MKYISKEFIIENSVHKINIGKKEKDYEIFAAIKQTYKIGANNFEPENFVPIQNKEQAQFIIDELTKLINE